MSLIPKNGNSGDFLNLAFSKNFDLPRLLRNDKVIVMQAILNLKKIKMSKNC